jgi:catechol 2,3-dioxygenase-like lactoylglutathione lyase family enzyme
MGVQLNHTIVWANDPEKSAAFFAELFDLPAPRLFAHFHVVDMENGVSLDYMQQDGKIALQHYAFLVSEPEFDAIFGRVKDRVMDYWADPTRSQPGQINTHFGGRGVYFHDLDGHFLEIITTPYGEASVYS